MKKKIGNLLVCLLVFVFALSVFAACADNGGEETGGNGGDNGTTVEKVAPTALFLNNLTADDDGDEGEGSAELPYTVSLSAGKSKSHNMTVQPANADNVFTWSVGTLEDGTFTASESTGITAAQSAAALTISAGADAGEYAIRGTARTGELTVYVKVTVTEYVALTSFTLDGFTAVDGKEWDYEFTTAKGTNWNVGAGITQRGQNLLDGKIFGGNQKPLHLDYFKNLYKFDFTPVPENATDTTWVMTAADPDVFASSGDGTWTANKAGDTVITVTNSAAEASLKIKLIVEDTLYPGILKSSYDAMTAKTNLDWYFDGDADDKELTLERLDAWNLVINKTTNQITSGDDGNQKAFYLGDPNRPYGIDLESRIDSGTPVKTGDTLALAWTKAVIPAGATTLQAVIGNNNKSINQYRIVMVEDNGTVHSLTDGWVNKDADGTGSIATYDVPAACKGKTVAVALESTLTEKDDNCEFHVKGVWINLPVESVEFTPDAATVSQGSTYELLTKILPTKVENDKMNYTVSTSLSGGEGKVTVDANGKVSVATDAPTGDYTITAKAQANEQATDTFTLTVTNYKNLTAFTAKYTTRGGELADLDGATFNEKQGASAYVLSFGYVPADASVQDFTVTYSEENIASITTKEDNGKQITELNFTAAGTTTVTVTPKAAEGASMAVTFTVTVRAGTVLNWGTQDILKEGKGWTAHGSHDEHDQGACLHAANAYFSYDVDISDMDLLTLGARTFVRGGETDSMLWVEIEYTDSQSQKQTVRLKANGYDYGSRDTILIDTDDSKFDSRNEFTFNLPDDLPDGIDTVTIKIGIDAGTHCCITDIRLS